MSNQCVLRSRGDLCIEAQADIPIRYPLFAILERT